jgi:hypothetical protein
VGSCDKNLYSVNENGEVNWIFTSGDTILSSPAIGDDSCIVFGSNDGYLYKLSPDGDKKWSYFAGGKIKSSPIIINDGLILFGNSNNEMVSLDKNGEVTWKYITDAPVSGTAVISRGGQILFGDEGGVLYNLDPLGNLQWYFKTDSPIESPILLTQNHLAIFGNLNGNVFVLKLDPRQSMYIDTIRYEWPTFKGNNKRTGNKTDVLLSLKNKGITALKEYCLFQNYPNPFNPSTIIKYQIPKSSFVSLKVFDAIGREVADLVSEQQNAGYYEVHFNAENLSSGIYFYRLQAGTFINAKKFVLLK